MDTSTVSFGERIAGVSGGVLILFMLILDWWGYDVGEGSFSASAGASAFQWLSFLDIVLLLIGLLAVGLMVARQAGSMPELPQPPGLIVAAAGALAVLIILFRILVPGDGPASDLVGLAGADIESTRKIGAFLGLIAAGGIAFGGWTAMNERASGQAPPAAPPPPPPPA